MCVPGEVEDRVLLAVIDDLRKYVDEAKSKSKCSSTNQGRTLRSFWGLRNLMKVPVWRASLLFQGRRIHRAKPFEKAGCAGDVSSDGPLELQSLSSRAHFE